MALRSIALRMRSTPSARGFFARGSATTPRFLSSSSAATGSIPADKVGADDNASADSGFAAFKRADSRNELSRRPPTLTDDEPAVVQEDATIGSLLLSRFGTTAEVTISKIFMAGFGWQGASCVAEGMGYGADSIQFALMTGCGDFAGVLAGHSLWMLGKKILWDDTINWMEEVHVGILLGSAAFCSGTMWQPFVNLVQSAGMTFNGSVGFVWAGCGLCFFGGLRLGRALYSPLLSGVESGNYENLKADAGLSLSVGAATGAFVGTDVSYGDLNWLRPVVGVEDGLSDIHGMVLAGSSTALGFAAVQSGQNVALSPKKNWVD